MIETILKDLGFFKLMEMIDLDMAREAAAEGCEYCGEKTLHHGDYPRKPLGGPNWNRRYSFCCAKEGCRKRKTPASVRFLGRKVYAGVVIVLICAMAHGLNEKRLTELRARLGVTEQTLERWRVWWREIFAVSGFWKVEKSRFLPRVKNTSIPMSLVKAFGATTRDGLMKLMKFLSPITVPTRKGGTVM